MIVELIFDLFFSQWGVAGRQHQHCSGRGSYRFAADSSLHFPIAALSSPPRVPSLCNRSRPSGYSNLEDSMKVFATLLFLALAGAAFAAMPAGANQAAAEDKKAPAAKKETKWQGHVVRINKDES